MNTLIKVDGESSSILVQVWDLPLRILHWLLVLAVLGAFITGELGGSLIDWHGRIGILVLGLLVFRLIWGFFGTTHARFTNFFPTPKRVLAYLKGHWQGIGHNPLGALSVLAFLGLMAAQVLTGLFGNDDISFQGPLYYLVSKETSDSLTGWHSWLFNGLAALIVLHVAAVGFHFKVKKNNLVRPMVTGKKVVPKPLASEVTGGGFARFALAVAVSSVVVWGVVDGEEVQSPTLPSATQAAAAPAW